MKDEIIYYCNTCKKEIKNPDLHNKRTNGEHDIRIKGNITIPVKKLKSSSTIGLPSYYLKLNEDGTLSVK